MPILVNLAWTWIKDHDLHELFTKAGGVGSSFVVSHLAALTATPQYANFWGRLYLTPPHITDMAGFEKEWGLIFASAWLTFDHFFWRAQRNKSPEKGGPK